MSKEFHQFLVRAVQEKFQIQMEKEFSDKHLSGNLLENGLKYTQNKIRVAPKEYDTAYFIKTSRMTSWGGIGVGHIRYWGGKKGQIKYAYNSYASDLNKKGSEFEVFRKKINAKGKKPRTTIAKLPVSKLERVMVYPHNHKRFAYRGLYFAIYNVVRKYKGEIQWKVRN